MELNKIGAALETGKEQTGHGLQIWIAVALILTIVLSAIIKLLFIGWALFLLGVGYLVVLLLHVLFHSVAIRKSFKNVNLAVWAIASDLCLLIAFLLQYDYDDSPNGGVGFVSFWQQIFHSVQSPYTSLSWYPRDVLEWDVLVFIPLFISWLLLFSRRFSGRKISSPQVERWNERGLQAFVAFLGILLIMMTVRPF